MVGVVFLPSVLDFPNKMALQINSSPVFKQVNEASTSAVIALVAMGRDHFENHCPRELISAGKEKKRHHSLSKQAKFNYIYIPERQDAGSGSTYSLTVLP